MKDYVHRIGRTARGPYGKGHVRNLKRKSHGLFSALAYNSSTLKFDGIMVYTAQYLWNPLCKNLLSPPATLVLQFDTVPFNAVPCHAELQGIDILRVRQEVAELAEDIFFASLFCYMSIPNILFTISNL